MRLVFQVSVPVKNVKIRRFYRLLGFGSPPCYSPLRDRGLKNIILNIKHGVTNIFIYHIEKNRVV